MSQSNFFAILSRMKYVNRWGLMRNSRNESLSDHTLDVVFISHALVVAANTYFGADLDEGRVCTLAAFHDAPEIITGDMPTPVKYINPEMKKVYSKVEEGAINTMINQLPNEMRPVYEKALSITDEKDKQLMRYVKAADKISALIKCIEEEQSGNRDFEDALRSTKEIIDKDYSDMPEVLFFLNNFLPGYYYTLDKQTKPDKENI